eukprot:767204-Hanusia_phi.AAC.3
MDKVLLFRKAATGLIIKPAFVTERIFAATRGGLASSRGFSIATSLEYNETEDESLPEFQGTSTPSIWEYAPEWCQEYEQHSHKYDLMQFLEKHCADHCTCQNSLKKVCPGSWADGFQKRRKRLYIVNIVARCDCNTLYRVDWLVLA